MPSTIGIVTSTWKPLAATGGDTVTEVNIDGVTFRVHEFITLGTASFTVTEPGTLNFVQVLTDRVNVSTNPSIETNATGYQNQLGNASGFPQRSTSQSFVGSASLVMKRTTTAGAVAIRTTNAESPAALENETFTFSAYVQPLTSQRSCRLQILARNSTFGALTTFNGSFVTCPTGQWTRISLTATMTDANTAFIFAVVVTESCDAGDEFAVDGILIEQTSELRPYFDGGIYDDNTVTATTAWTGTANNSTSTATATQTLDPVASPLSVNVDVGKVSVRYPITDPN
jgi:hypothetical protein